MSNINTMNFTGHSVNRFPSYTTTTTTTSYGPGPSGYCNGSSAYNPANMNSGINLSSKGQMLMCLMSVMNQLTNGAFGDMMNSLGIGSQGHRQCQNPMNPCSNPGFGQNRECGNGNNQSMEQQWNEFNHFRKMQHRQRMAQAGVPRRGGRQMATDRAKMAAFKAQSANTPQAPKGQATEMKAGQTTKAPNGSLVTWGKDGKVDIKYKDANGQLRTIDVKDGMMRMDGGKPVKLENTGQLLKLPNGDVVGLGNNPQGPEGQKLCRVVLADNVDQVKCDPASATNIYDVKNMEHTHRGIVPQMTNMNFNAASYNGFNGSYQMLNANLSVLTGIPYEFSHTVQELKHSGVR